MSHTGSLVTVQPRTVPGAGPQFSVAERSWCAQLGVQGAWLDHLTAGVFPPGTAVRHMAWPFSPRYTHWVQAGWVQV